MGLRFPAAGDLLLAWLPAQKQPNSKRPELISHNRYQSPGRSRMNGFLFFATISLLVAVQIQMGVLGENKTNVNPKAATPRHASVTTKEVSPKISIKPPRNGASSLIDVGSHSFFFFANTLMCLLYLG